MTIYRKRETASEAIATGKNQVELRTCWTMIDKSTMIQNMIMFDEF
jgi:hypothetical protein